ncbi:bifunctional riboflavin kinase/FAD synthetase [Virgibacillus halodenitrificans]|uniref:bifunctional riboflavin kinase/FAD synthetase n=1 Tax=Virgibacillus halodenitrificans TaxID=1482 RepID=UPI00137023E8|nr:bifunctional riboflavin kinase/FAD synthetase [Virgibacillus halodenitrificans]MYL46006.1 bifunctional riboflavin kinase/FAD synthetase [Virgibacillus halodenitrificans]
MKVIELTYPHTLIGNQQPASVSAIGFFDGIHKGHQKVINTAVSIAENEKIDSAVITFHPHPSVVLNKKVQHVKYITPLQQKKEILKDLGVDILYIIKFNKDLAALAPQTFIDHFIKGLNVKHLVAGFDFSYGHKGEGNMDTIRAHAENEFAVTKITKVEMDEEKVSSTRIRKLLQTGDVEEASNLLGRPLAAEGPVIKGDQRGRTIGYPTANMKVDSDTILPKNGVYAVKVTIGESQYYGMANLGVKPTFTPEEVKPSVEVNIFDFHKDIYDETILIEWYRFVRDEIKFSNVEALVKQIAEDEKEIRNYFEI